MEKPKFKPGTRIRFVKGGLRGRTGIVMGVVTRSNFEVYKVGMVGQWDDPYDQRYWKRVRAEFIDYESVIDKLGDILEPDEEDADVQRG